MSEVPFSVTMYGFKWGAMEVTRMSEINGNVCISIKTDMGRTINVYASPTGRSLRAFNGMGGELSVDAPSEGGPR